MMRGGGGPPMRGMMRGGPPMRGQGPPNFNGPRQFRPNMNHGGGGPGGGMGMRGQPRGGPRPSYNAMRPPMGLKRGFRGGPGQGPRFQGHGERFPGPPGERFPPPPQMGNGNDFPPPPDDDFPPHPSIMRPEDVTSWLDAQHPMVIRNIMFHCRYVLEQRGVPLEEPPSAPPDMTGWYENAPGAPMKRPGLGMGGPDPKRAKGPQQWTPAGWVTKDNSHKVTSKMRPLPEPELIPPNGSVNYPEAAADRDKLKMLTNNVNMMNFELTKICKTFKIMDFQKDKMSTYPEEAKGRLQMAVTCVEKAEQTLKEFKDFLKDDKYKEWHEAQKKKTEDTIKQMIGEMPTGTPFNRREAAQASTSQEGVDNEDDDDDDGDEEGEEEEEADGDE